MGIESLVTQVSQSSPVTCSPSVPSKSTVNVSSTNKDTGLHIIPSVPSTDAVNMDFPWYRRLCCFMGVNRPSRGSSSAPMPLPHIPSPTVNKSDDSDNETPTHNGSIPTSATVTAEESIQTENNSIVSELETEETSYLLPPLNPSAPYKPCLVLDLDETLVHSSFKPIPDPDFVLSIELEGQTYNVYVRKRPGVDEFMTWCAERFEIVIFTASLAKYANPLLDILDPHKTISHRLFRESCVQHYGNYVKDMTMLGRKIEHSIIVDNSPFSYMFQPENAIPILSWFNDYSDRHLYTLLPLLEELSTCQSALPVLERWKKENNIE